MIIKRTDLPILTNVFSRISELKFNINTQYKLLKMKKAIAEEEEIYLKQLEALKEYCVKDENGQFITNKNGGYQIDETKAEECGKLVQEINAIQIQVPDIYFTIEELEPLDLTFNELEAFDSFIKL